MAQNYFNTQTERLFIIHHRRFEIFCPRLNKTILITLVLILYFFLEFDPSALAGPSSSTPKPSSSSTESTPIDTGSSLIDL